MLGFLIPFLSKLEQYPVLDTALRDLLGNNLPKIALTRSNAERMDVAISQFGNTLLFGLGGTAMDLLLKRCFAQAQQAASHTAPYRWAEISRSLGIYSTMASVMWAMPFVRNYVTAKKTGSLSFSDVIQAGGASKTKTPQQQAALAVYLKENKRKALVILGWGAAGVAIPAALGRWAAHASLLGKGKAVGQGVLDFIYRHKIPRAFVLEGGEFKRLAGIPSLLFWGLPAYFGWYQASRDAYEKQEVAIRATNFTFCFFGPAMLMDKILQTKFSEKFKSVGLKEMTFQAVEDQVKAGKLDKATQQAAQNFLKWKNLGSMGLSVALLGITPQLLNIYLTGRRMKQDQAPALRPQNGSVRPPAWPGPVPAFIPAMVSPQFQPLFQPGVQAGPGGGLARPSASFPAGAWPLNPAAANGYPFPPAMTLGRPGVFG